jgi:hypothetical protein
VDEIASDAINRSNESRHGLYADDRPPGDCNRSMRRPIRDTSRAALSISNAGVHSADDRRTRE